MVASSTLHRSVRRAALVIAAAAVLSGTALATSSIAGAAASTATAPMSSPSTDGCPDVAAGEFADVSLLDTTTSLDELTMFGAAVEASGLTADVETSGPLTVFAPSTAAFEAIPQNAFDALLADLDSLQALVGHHIVTGVALSPENLGEVGTVDTLNGAVEVTVDADVVTVDGVDACAPIETADGVIYLLDEVLTPPTDAAGGPCASVPGSSVPGSSVPGSSAPESSAPAASVPC